MGADIALAVLLFMLGVLGSGTRKVLSSHPYNAAEIPKGTLKDLHVVAQASPWLAAGPSAPGAAP